jgi:ABC-type microcin C transport system duplicated ATPase subunit YejF
MNDSNRDRTAAELERLATRLQEERATATPLELDRIKLQAMRQAERTRPGIYARQKGRLMKSRLALTMVIAAGFMLSTTGATLAITGASGSGSAAQNQYKHVLPAQEEGGNQGTKGQSLESESSSEVEPVAAEQVAVTESGSGELPFTGFLAIPLLIVGAGLLTVGAFLRKKSGNSRTAGS